MPLDIFHVSQIQCKEEVGPGNGPASRHLCFTLTLGLFSTRVSFSWTAQTFVPSIYHTPQSITCLGAQTYSAESRCKLESRVYLKLFARASTFGPGDQIAQLPYQLPTIMRFENSSRMANFLLFLPCIHSALAGCS